MYSTVSAGGSFAFLVVFQRAFLVHLEDKVQYLPVLRCFTSWVVAQEDNISVRLLTKIKTKRDVLEHMNFACASNMQLKTTNGNYLMR